MTLVPTGKEEEVDNDHKCVGVFARRKHAEALGEDLADRTYLLDTSALVRTA